MYVRAREITKDMIAPTTEGTLSNMHPYFPTRFTSTLLGSDFQVRVVAVTTIAVTTIKLCVVAVTTIALLQPYTYGPTTLYI